MTKPFATRSTEDLADTAQHGTGRDERLVLALPKGRILKAVATPIRHTGMTHARDCLGGDSRKLRFPT